MEIFDFREPFFYKSERHLIKIGKYAAYVAPEKNEKKTVIFFISYGSPQDLTKEYRRQRQMCISDGRMLVLVITGSLTCVVQLYQFGTRYAPGEETTAILPNGA